MRILGRIPETLRIPMAVLVAIVVIVPITLPRFWMWQDTHIEDKLVEIGFKIGGTLLSNPHQHLQHGDILHHSGIM